MPKTMIIIVCMLTFLLPLSSSLVPHAGSVFLAALAGLGIYAWLTRKTSPAFDAGERRVLWAFALYFAVCFLLYLLHGFIRGHENFRWDLDPEVRMLAFIPIYYLFYRTGLKFWILWYGAAIASIIFGLFAVLSVYGWSGGFPEPDALYSAAFGPISVISAFIALSGFTYFHKKHPALILLPVLAFPAGIVAASASLSGTAIVAIPFLSFIFFLQLGRTLRPWRNRIIFIMAMALLYTGCFHLPGSKLEGRIQARIVKTERLFSATGPDFALRLSLWKEGWKLFIQHPLLGAGKKGYEHEMARKADLKQIAPEMKRFDSPQNMYLTQMAAYGVTGLFALLAILFTPCWILLPGARLRGPAGDFAYAGIMLVMGCMISAAVETVFYRNAFTSFYIVLLAAILFLTTCGKEHAAPE